MNRNHERRCKNAGRTVLRAVVGLVLAGVVLVALLWPDPDGPGRVGDEHSGVDGDRASAVSGVAPESPARAQHVHEGSAEVPVAAESTSAESAAAPQLYTCGMHPQVLSEEPGSCPICGMRLTPVQVEPSAAASGRAAAASGTKAGTRSGERKIKYWRAPMDPTYISDKPGKSPMGMDLIPVYEDEVEAGPVVRISPVVVQNMGVRTAPVRRARLVRVIRTVGRIEYDETLVREVTTKFTGWIEDLYVDYTGQYVEAGMPLFSVYSPELYATQEEYLLALRNRHAVRSEVLPEAHKEMGDLIESTRIRLKFFDISDEQIREIEQRGKPSKTLVITSPYAGVVVEKNALEGMHITPGTKLYTIADLSRVWVYVDVFENEVPFVKIGQDATMELSYLPGQVFHGKVIYVYPFVETKTRTVKVRLEFENPHLELKPGMFADVRIEADLGREGLVVPRAAVIDTGQRQVAFVALGEGRFEPRELRVGVDLGDDRIEVLQGLLEGEHVVVSGQFLLDSESKLREAVLKMMERKRAETTPSAEAAQAKHSSGADDQEGAHPGAELAAAGRAAQAAVEVDDAHATHASAAKQKRSTIDAAVAAGSAAALAPEAEDVVVAYLELQGLLAHDNTRRFDDAIADLEAPLARLAEATDRLDGEVSAAVRGVVDHAITVVRGMRGVSPDAVRAHFVELSNDVIAIVRAVGPEHIRRRLRSFYCPMAGAYWLQEAEEPANPYYGFSMLRCGDPQGLGSLGEDQR